MKLIWKVRYLDKADREYKDRILYLDTSTLDPAPRAAIELVVERATGTPERDILRHRHLFHEDIPESAAGSFEASAPFNIFCLLDYFEDETGKEITPQERGRILYDDPTAVLIGLGAKQHDIDLELAEKQPIPVVGVLLTPEEIRLLGYFRRDLQELKEAAFLKDDPGTIKERADKSTVKTAVTDDEIRSFVMVFRRLYMKGDTASFVKAVEVFTKAVGNHALGAWATAAAEDFETHLAATPEFRPIRQVQPCTFTTKRLIDVFLYTQYAHQPNEKRERQYKECLAQVQGDRGLLFYIFLIELQLCSLKVIIVGNRIVEWFGKYCDHHEATPDILNSVRHDHPGLGAAEKQEDRSDRVTREKTEELAEEYWKKHGRPEGGPAQFLAEARKKLDRALEGQETD